MNARNYSGVALVLEGGGFRGMYTAGVLDVFLERKMYFENAYGVSAGAAYGLSYASRQKGRNCEVNRRFTSDPRYFGIRNIFSDGSLFGWNFVYSEVPQVHIPFDYATFGNSFTRLHVGMTECESGSAVFVESNGLDPDLLKDLLSASSALPFISRRINFGGVSYLDGGISDAIPVERALKSDNRAVVILTRNSGYRKKPMSMKLLIKGYFAGSPRLADALLSRPERYNDTLDLLEKLEREGRIFVIRPKGAMDVSRIENDPEKLQRLYDMAQKETADILSALEAWLG